ncbi:MAG: hypothetical protein J4478_04550 [Candidatus Diapherotrites archaeon]|uniref:Uncharacterized protein n=1 Tax=Candidatus Iainarchaeum sp. TaxID=3101447 RepID=A0A8T4KYE5_9ARCH|nr:hypothetical protein [Candidatus Diapherotrites archaeon]
MAIKPICDSCGKELDKFGALLFSPPDSGNIVRKFHVCVECFEKLKASFRKSQN